MAILIADKRNFFKMLSTSFLRDSCKKGADGEDIKKGRPGVAHHHLPHHHIFSPAAFPQTQLLPNEPRPLLLKSDHRAWALKDLPP